MESSSSSHLVQKIINNATAPLVLRGFNSNWPYCQWTEEQWCSVFGKREIPFRCMKRGFKSDEPCWERKCSIKKMTFKQFLEEIPNSQEWMYFDYKHLHQWFAADSELCKGMSWKTFGFPEKGAADTTFWAGSRGAHTPAHQDSYGVNIVAQVHGKKRWILFPPESGGLKPTRVPYEESSVYSQLNFYCPNNVEAFKKLSGGLCVELSAGDALILPRGWWHYVNNLAPLNIALNVWLPHKEDTSARVSEALTKILVAQVCKDLPEDTVRLIINPNEDDLLDTPLAVLFLQLETVAKKYLDNRRKSRREKLQKTGDADSTAIQPGDDNNIDITELINDKANNIEIPKSITNEELISLLYEDSVQDNYQSQVTETDGLKRSLRLTKAVIDSFTQSNVIDIVKENLLAKLS